MKKIIENWRKHFLAETTELNVWSIVFNIKVDQTKKRAVIDDTLARIRAIPSITVVNSDTDKVASTPTHSVVVVEFKFIPPGISRPTLETHLAEIRKSMINLPYVSSIAIDWNSIRQIS